VRVDRKIDTFLGRTAAIPIQSSPVGGKALQAGILALLLLAAAPADTREQLQRAEQARTAELAASRDAEARLAAAQAEAQRLASARVIAAAQLRTAETATAEAAESMATLAQRRAAAQARMAQRAEDLAPLLPLIERLSLYPAETLLAVPAPPEAVMSGLLVLKGLARQLETEAATLRTEQTDIARLSAQMADQETSLSAAQATQAAQEATLDRQIADAQGRARAAEDAGADAARRAAEAAARADTLRGAIAEIEAGRRAEEARALADATRAQQQRRLADAAASRRRQVALAAPAGPGLADQLGQLASPVNGTIVRAWGETGEAGPVNGMSYQAAPASRVVTPCGGKVVFAGPFRSFGLLMIVDCGGGYHIVLAGLDRLDTQVGRSVHAGEPVGIMPGWDPHSPGPYPTLYVELRRDGQPLNPAPFLRARS